MAQGSELAPSLTGRVKNTFLHFEDSDTESDLGQRPSSDPTSSRSASSVASLSETEECPVPYRFRGDLKHKQQACHRAPNGLRTLGEPAQPTETGKKHLRPCKSKRDKFRKYVDSLKAQLEEDPQGFDCSKIQHPQNLVQDKRGVDKVASIIEKYRAQITAQFSSASNTMASSPSEPRDSDPYIVSL